MVPEARTPSIPQVTAELRSGKIATWNTRPNKGLYVHNKVILIDGTYQGVGGQKLVYATSQNLTLTSLRESNEVMLRIPNLPAMAPTRATSNRSKANPCKSSRVLPIQRPRQPPVSTAPVKSAAVRRQKTTVLTLTSSHPWLRRVTAVVLAGGASRRFRPDKLAEQLDGEPLLDRVLASLPEQVDDGHRRRGGPRGRSGQ